MKTDKILAVEKYSEWLMDKFKEWEKSQHRSYSAFARYLGVKQSSLSQWMAGNYPPSDKNLKKIAAKLGYEIYDVLGLPRPEAGEEELANQYNVPPEQRQDFIRANREFVRRWLREHGSTLEETTDPEFHQGK